MITVPTWLTSFTVTKLRDAVRSGQGHRLQISCRILEARSDYKEVVEGWLGEWTILQARMFIDKVIQQELRRKVLLGSVHEADWKTTPQTLILIYFVNSTLGVDFKVVALGYDSNYGCLCILHMFFSDTFISHFLTFNGPSPPWSPLLDSFTQSYQLPHTRWACSCIPLHLPFKVNTSLS